VAAGSLTVVGIGIRAGLHVTAEARAALESADEVLYVVADPVAAGWLESLNPNARSLDGLYEPGRSRLETYAAMTDEIVASVRAGKDVCAAFYGHPGVFVRPGHSALRRVRAEGHEARMLPGISAEDCLFCDLGIDPADTGWQSYEADGFLEQQRPVDTAAILVLWQISVVGQETYTPDPDWSGLPALVEYLGRFYPREHEAIVYEASSYPVCEPVVLRAPLARLTELPLRPLATLVVPPVAARP
jgi:precorrin-6B methylase 1